MDRHLISFYNQIFMGLISAIFLHVQSICEIAVKIL
jgi:hypothetical protein